MKIWLKITKATAQQVNYAHRRKTMNILFSHYIVIFITALVRDKTMFTG